VTHIDLLAHQVCGGTKSPNKLQFTTTDEEIMGGKPTTGGNTQSFTFGCCHALKGKKNDGKQN